MRSLGAPHIGQRSEAELISAFVDRVGDLRPTLVGFNSHAFDLNVLRYRAMIHAIAAPGLNARGYFKRYDDSAVDLMEVLSGFDARSRMSLDDLARTMAFPGKPEGVDGSRVWDMFKEGRIEDVAHYCEADIVATYRLWLRYELFRGTLTKEGFDASEEDLTGFIRARLEERPHLASLVGEVRSQPASLEEQIG